MLHGGVGNVLGISTELWIDPHEYLPLSPKVRLNSALLVKSIFCLRLIQPGCPD